MHNCFRCFEGEATTDIRIVRASPKKTKIEAEAEEYSDMPELIPYKQITRPWHGLVQTRGQSGRIMFFVVINYIHSVDVCVVSDDCND